MLLKGRDFTERDRQGSTLVAVANETFARGFWPGEDAIGKRFHMNRADGPLVEIAGVVRDGKYNSLGETQQRHLYLPFLQGYTPFFTFVLKTVSDPGSSASAVRTELQKLDPGLPITSTKTMAEHLGFAFWGARIGATLLGTFAVLGLLLSAVGLYGVLAFVVNRSIPEIGVRMALGASPDEVLRLFVRRGLTIALGGAAIGIAGALVTTRVLTSYLFGVNALDPGIFAGVTALLVFVAFIACYLPSKRAARIEPLRALRYE